MVIKFGPAGLGAVKDAVDNLERYSELGLRVCEIAFTYGIYIKGEEDIQEIKEAAEKLGVSLSIHAPYWVNLNSKEKIKVEQSKQRILSCCKIGDKLGAEKIVFHPGYYGDMEREEAYENIKNVILEMQEEIAKNGWKVKLAPETMGKINVFGSVEEIARLVDDTGCGFCLDFAHVLARDKKVDYDKIERLFGRHGEWHCHFSGIEYGEKGERRHIKTDGADWKDLLSNLPRGKEITIINESLDPAGDSVEGLRLLKE